jgi:hypothetical protein
MTKKKRNGSKPDPNNLLDLHLRISPEIFEFLRRERELWSKETGVKMSLSATAIRALRVGLDGNDSFGHGERAKNRIAAAIRGDHSAVESIDREE